MYSKAIIAPAGRFFFIPLKLFVVKNNTANNLLKKSQKQLIWKRSYKNVIIFFFLYDLNALYLVWLSNALQTVPLCLCTCWFIVLLYKEADTKFKFKSQQLPMVWLSGLNPQVPVYTSIKVGSQTLVNWYSFYRLLFYKLLVLNYFRPLTMFFWRYSGLNTSMAT